MRTETGTKALSFGLSATTKNLNQCRLPTKTSGMVLHSPPPPPAFSPSSGHDSNTHAWFRRTRPVYLEERNLLSDNRQQFRSCISRTWKDLDHSRIDIKGPPKEAEKWQVGGEWRPLVKLNTERAFESETLRSKLNLQQSTNINSGIRVAMNFVSQFVVSVWTRFLSIYNIFELLLSHTSSKRLSLIPIHQLYI